MKRLVTLVLCSVSVLARAQSPPAVPKALEDWRAWVLKGAEFHRCPFLSGSDAARESSYRCVWPERLRLSVDTHSGRFTQGWQVYTEGWVALPGDLLHWPQGVSLDEHPAAPVARNGVPSVWLAVGAHLLSGRFEWQARPETLAIAAPTALVDLTVDNRPVARPELAGGVLALGRQSAAPEPRQLDVQVYRLIEDDIPLHLVTRVQLRAAGDAREEWLPAALPEGFVPVSIESELPVRLEGDGRLRLQVRTGSFEVVLEARQAEPTASVSLAGQSREEVWSFAADDRLRVATAEGVAGIDPAQANVPENWRGFPAFRMQPGAQLKIVERSRGLANMDQNRLHLSRRVWLDFDHRGFTAVDELSGTLRRDWRLAMRAPYQLASARSGNDWLLITHSGAAGETGVEVRNPVLQLTTLARSAHPFAALSATGWTSSFEGASGELYLPPGHRLLAVLGADESPTAWLNRWGLWNLFGVLVVVVFAYWVAGAAAAALAAAALLLTYQAAPAYIWGWGNLLAAIALARAAPAGRLARAANVYRAVSFAVLGVALMPFLWSEVRHAIYPQLEVSAYEPVPVPPPVSAHVLREDVAPNAPPPPVQYKRALEKQIDEAQVQSRAAIGGLNSVVVTGQRRSNAASTAPSPTRYAAGTLIQAGPGIPGWNYGAHPYGWSGPVEPDQTVRFVVLGPGAVALWRIAGVALLVLLFVWLARESWRGGFKLARALHPGATLAAMLLLCIAGGAARDAHAESTPDPALLAQLRDRLTEAPRCAPTCAEIVGAQIQVSGEHIQVQLQVSALAALAVPIPSAGDRWRIEALAADGASSLALGREADDALWIPLKSGTHTLRIDARLLGDTVPLAFPLAPRAISITAPGWETAGVAGGRLVSGSLLLSRQGRAGATASTLSSAGAQDFPPFVRITRDFRLDLDWSVSTTVERVAPQAAAFTVAVPLVPGESVLTEGLNVRGEGVALVGLSAGEDEFSWNSSLAHRDTLTLLLTATPARAEIWRFSVSPQWRVAFKGPPAVMPADLDGSPWVFEYHPQVGEQLELTVSRPRALAGSTLAIDAVRQRTTIGKRSSEHELELHYRSTEGGRHSIQLPKEARVSAVTVDGAPTQIRPDAGELPLSILPGAHTVHIAWRSTDGASLAAHPDRVDLRAPASNITTQLRLPADRWPLFARGAGVGPAFLYWGELVVFVVLAYLLGGWAYSPLRRSEWLLLGLGLSTLSWSVLVAVAVWLFAMRWREQWRAGSELARWRFNLLQCLLAALTLFAVASLVFSGVRYGLLASPDMGVAGPGSEDHLFSWFADQAGAALPHPVVYSAPLWLYRTLMFGWALWIAVALARWLRFAWGAWISGGLWRNAAPRPPAQAAVAKS